MAEQNPEDVQGDSSAPPEADAQTDAAAVTGSAEAPETDAQGVPWRNRMAEMERRHEKHLQDLQATFQQQFQQALQQFQQPQIQPTKPVTQQYTDDELLALGNQGHAVAMSEYVDRQVSKRMASQQRVSLADQHAGALRQMYPDFNNTTSPLYQAANTLYRQYLAAGEAPDARTQALAMSTAAAAYAKQQSQQQQGATASEGARVRDVDAHQSVAGTSIAPAGANRPRPKAPTVEQQEIARKFGVKDAAKALERFRKRAEDGRTTFGPGLSSAAERMLP